MTLLSMTSSMESTFALELSMTYVHACVLIGGGIVYFDFILFHCLFLFFFLFFLSCFFSNIFYFMSVFTYFCVFL